MLEINDETSNKPQLSVVKIFTKSVSFDSANIWSLNEETLRPQANLDIKIDTTTLKDNQHEVIITLNVTAKSNNHLVYTSKILQGGIFKLENFSEDQKQFALNVICTGIIYPYASERLSNLSTHAGLPALQLTPINFEALYQKSSNETHTSETMQ